MVFMWTVTFQLENEINLHFLVAGRTNNSRDRAFGFVKRRLKTHIVVTTRRMMRVVGDSSATNMALCSVEVR